MCSLKKSSAIVGTGDGRQGRQSQSGNCDYGDEISDGDDSGNNSSKSDNDDNNGTDDDDHWVAGVSSTLFKRTMQELWMSNATYLSQGSWKIAAQNHFRLAFDRFKSDGQHDASTFKLSHLHLLHIASPINKDVFTTGIAVTTTCEESRRTGAVLDTFSREGRTYMSCQRPCLLSSSAMVCMYSKSHLFLMSFFFDGIGVDDNAHAGNMSNKHLLVAVCVPMLGREGSTGLS